MCDEACVSVIKPGSIVIIDGDTYGVVTQACLTAANRVQYEVAYWLKGERKAVWLEAFEVAAGGAVKMQAIGFASCVSDT